MADPETSLKEKFDAAILKIAELENTVADLKKQLVAMGSKVEKLARMWAVN